MDAQVIASIIAAATALAAVILGPFLTTRASRSHMLGPMRQAWINSLRDTISEFSGYIRVGALDTGGVMVRDEQVRETAVQARIAHMQRALELKEKIALLVNHKEAEHREIVRLTDAAYSAYVDRRDPSGPLKALREITVQVLKTEWDVVKNKAL